MLGRLVGLTRKKKRFRMIIKNLLCSWLISFSSLSRESRVSAFCPQFWVAGFWGGLRVLLGMGALNERPQEVFSKRRDMLHRGEKMSKL